jgi:hypothetical protein
VFINEEECDKEEGSKVHDLREGEHVFSGLRYLVLLILLPCNEHLMLIIHLPQLVSAHQVKYIFYILLSKWNSAPELFILRILIKIHPFLPPLLYLLY